MERCGIRKTSDVIYWTGHHFAPISPNTVGLPFGTWSLSSWWSGDPQAILLSPGQFWACSERPSIIYEIIGWRGRALVCTQWNCPHWSPSQRHNIYLKENTDMPLPVVLTKFTHKCIVEDTPKGPRLLLVTTAPNTKRMHLKTYADQLPRPLNSIMATDGTYKRPPSIFNEYVVPSTHAGLVLISDTPPYQRLAAYRFKPPLTLKRVFNSELAAIAFGVRMFPGLLLSDCQGAIAAAFSDKPSTASAATAHSARSRIQWTRSHPETRKERDLWTAADHAIFEADLVAEGQGDFTFMAYSAVTTRMLANSRKWAPIGPEGVVLDTPLHLKQSLDLTNYLAMRVKHGRAVWSQPGLQLLTSTATTIPQRGSLAKLYIGHFLADHQYNNSARPVCKCGCRDILADWLGRCTRPDMITLKNTFLTDLAGLDIPKSMALVLFRLLEAQDNVLLFRGIWSKSCQDAIQDAFLTTPQATVRTWRKALLKIITLLTGHALSLQHLSSSTSEAAVRVEARRTTSLDKFMSTSKSPILSVSPIDRVNISIDASIYYTPMRCDIMHNPIKTGKSTRKREQTKVQPKKEPHKKLRGLRQIDSIFLPKTEAPSYKPIPFPAEARKKVHRYTGFTTLAAKVDLVNLPPPTPADIRNSFPPAVKGSEARVYLPPSASSAASLASWHAHPP